MGNFSKSFCSKSPFKKEEPAEEKEKKGVSINDGIEKFTPEMARKWLDRHDKGEIKLNRIELAKANERANE